uniref:Uncharacterized protein n=1 Tax=viral metagenome TaxID=1070528 RepID=A0A6C0J9H8_9ZZZZ
MDKVFVPIGKNKIENNNITYHSLKYDGFLTCLVDVIAIWKLYFIF